MNLNGTAFADLANSFAEYAEGEDADVITKTDGTEIKVLDVVRAEFIDPEVTRGSIPIRQERFTASTRTQLHSQELFTHDGDEFTVATCDRERLAGADWPFHLEAVRHVT